MRSRWIPGWPHVRTGGWKPSAARAGHPELLRLGTPLVFFRLSGLVLDKLGLFASKTVHVQAVRGSNHESERARVVHGIIQHLLPDSRIFWRPRGSRSGKRGVL